MSKLSPEEIGLLALRFAPEGILEAPVPFGGGHINDTYLFSPAGEKGVRYVLQRINRSAFPRPEDVMDNMLRVTEHLRRQIVLRGGDPQRETLRRVFRRGPKRGLLALLQLCQRLGQL